MQRKLRNAGLLIVLAAALALAACASSMPAAPTAPPPIPAPPADPRATPGAETLNDYRAWIAWARRQHPYEESEARMYAVMMCESGGRPLIVNPAGPYSGLFQYTDRTWNDTWNIYRDRGMKNPEAQILATALAWSLDKQSHWTCYRKTAATQ